MSEPSDAAKRLAGILADFMQPDGIKNPGFEQGPWPTLKGSPTVVESLRVDLPGQYAVGQRVTLDMGEYVVKFAVVEFSPHDPNECVSHVVLEPAQ
jgi:hypothetical protein